MGCYKINFEGAFKGNLEPVGFGCVICDHSSTVICALCGPLGEYNSIKTKVRACC